MDLINQYNEERSRWESMGNSFPDFVVLGNEQYNEFGRLRRVFYPTITQQNSNQETLCSLDVIHAANRESCILFGTYAPSPCG